MRSDIIIVNNFYKNPSEIIEYAKNLKYYFPYNTNKMKTGPESELAWFTSRFTKFKSCPFRSSEKLISTLEEITNETIDRDYWNRDLVLTPSLSEDEFYKNFRFYSDQMINEYLIRKDGARPSDFAPSLWNCAFQVKTKLDTSEAIHNHIEDFWQCTSEDGWNGLIYLNKSAPERAGVKFWRNKYYDDSEWMSGQDRWDMLDDVGNVFNRLVLFRGNTPHSGAPGFGENLCNGRLFQTFFFRIMKPKSFESVDPFVTT